MNIELIWQEYSVLLKRFLLSRVANESDVEDILQAVMLKAHNNIDSLAQYSSTQSWLLQIANRSVIDFYRSQAKTKEIDIDQMWYFDEQELEHELLKCLQPFIKQLPEASARLLLDVELNAGSQKRYAEQHGISYSTLKSRVQKSRMLLKRLFEQCCEFEQDAQGRIIGYGKQKKSSKSCSSC